jgi:hypothetical protein
MEKPAFTRACLSYVRDIMWLCVYLWLSRYIMWWWDGYQHSSTWCQAHVGSCGHVLSWQALNATTSWDPDASSNYLLLRVPRAGWLDARDRLRQTCGEILSTHVYRKAKKWWCRLPPNLVLFRLVAPPLQIEVVGPYLVCGVWFPSHLPLERASRIQNFEP